MNTDVIREELNLPRVRLDSVKFSTDQSNFKIVQMTVLEGGKSGLTGKRITVRGNLPKEIKIGEELEIKVLEEEHDRFGLQYNLLNWNKSLPLDETGLMIYFRKNFTGIGEKRSRALIQEFGSGVLKLLDGDIDQAVKTICERLKWTEETTRSLLEQWHEAILPKRMEFSLLGAGLSGRQINQIKEDLGESFADVINSNPYKLTQVSGIGFKTADKIAMQQGIKKDCPYRVWSGITHLLIENSKKGDCFIPESSLTGLAAGLLQISTASIRNALDTRQPDAEPIYIDSERNFWNSQIYRDEQLAAEFIVSLLETKSGYPVELKESEWDKIFAKFQIDTGVQLTEEQCEAVRTSLKHDVLIITGNPGTGKTTILKAILMVLEYLGCGSISLCAPTGKAARRMSEACGKETSTIHRLLGIGSAEGSFSYANPLPSDVVVVDEVSMLDISLFATLVTSIKRSAKLILIGDKDQLASIGPGRVLADLLEAEIPHIKLTQPQRQAQNSFIVKLAHAINRGKVLDLPAAGSEENVWFIPVKNEDDGINFLGKLLKRMDSKNLNIERTKVLSPQKKGECGVFALNRYLQSIINPSESYKNQADWKYGIIRENDLLIQLRNDRFLDLMNGEEVRVNEIKDVEKDQEFQIGAVIETETGREITLPISEMDMQHSYALTVHKSQGSEWDVVVLFCLPGQLGFYSRRMLYTALTRAKKMAVIIGDLESLKTVVGREFEARRKTKLIERIKSVRKPFEIDLTFGEH